MFCCFCWYEASAGSASATSVKNFVSCASEVFGARNGGVEPDGMDERMAAPASAAVPPAPSTTSINASTTDRKMRRKDTVTAATSPV